MGVGPRKPRAGLLGALATVLALSGVTGGVVGAPMAHAKDTNPDFILIETDLEHILKQIQIAEAHAAGGNLLCASPTDTTGKCVPDAALPLGLRTVDGSGNNLLEPTYGAADQPFPRKLPTYWRKGETPPPGAPQIPGTTGICQTAPDNQPAGATCYRQSQGFVYDSEPRIISNLIVDQTLNNPAAANAADNTPGSSVDGQGNVFIPNTAPDEGLSAPFNAWFTFFGQFFDHGLDLVNKGGNGTMVVPLRPDDPLWDTDGFDDIPGNADDFANNFLMLSRATRYPGPDGQVGTEDDVHNNQTTPFIDQNQTYTSHPSHQVFLREYELRDHDGDPGTPDVPVDTGHLLDGTLPNGGTGGLATWADVKRQAREVLGIALGAQGTPSEGNNDYPDVANVPQVDVDPYGNFVRGENGFPVLQMQNGDRIEGNLVAPITTVGAARTNHAFLDDIAHGASQDPDDLSGYDNVTLNEHFITGDGRGNENIGLTSVHHVFHSEHNRMAQAIEDILDKPENAELKLAFMGEDNQYDELLGEELPDGPEADDWTYEQRLFQAAKFPTEMQYQHLVFEEFARKVQPAIDAIVFNENSYDATLNPATTAEFAHVVYRFGHSMLTEDIERRLPGVPGVEDVSLLDGFLNPRTYDNDGALTPDQAAGAVINGTTNQVGGQIDEHVIDTLRNNLLGLPLDLATINMVRARDAGVPPLQTARKVFFEESGDPLLEPYDNWVDFGLGMKNGDNFGRESANPNASLVNFVAAYGKHDTITSVSTVVGKRDAADLIVNGGDGAPADRVDFMTGTGDWANQGGNTVTGLEEVDFWMGGLAEALEPFGGMLGSTFNYVFERQLEDLQFGDRFYYLFRNQGNQLFAALEANSFSGLIQRNTDATLLPADIFGVQDPFIDLENLPTPLPEGLVQMADGTYRWDGDEHIEIHGLRTGEIPATNDKIRAGQGDDALWGYAGNDRIEGGSGNDSHLGGAGNDILTDTFGDDNIKGGWGNDAIKAGSGDDLVLGGHGHDYVNTGSEFKTVFSGTGRDFIVGGNGRDTVFGGEEDDWIEGGAHGDLLQGDNADQFQANPHGGNDIVDGGAGNDDIEGEGGHDVLVGRALGTDRMEGLGGFDWATYRGENSDVDVDLRFTTLQRPDAQAIRDRYDLVEAVSGGNGNDVLRGMGQSVDDLATLDGQALTQETLDITGGLEAMLDPGHANNYAERFMAGAIDPVTRGVSNLIIGGPGSDMLQGRAGDDFLDGDAQLDVFVRVNGTRYNSPSATALQNGIFNGTIDPGDIQTFREVATTPNPEDNDIAVFGAPSSQYTVTDMGDGYWQVAHDNTDTAPDLREGADILRNIELLQFSNGCFVLGEEPMEACGSYGTASLDYEPPATEDEPITARVVFDGTNTVDTPTNVQFRWVIATEDELNGAEGWRSSVVQSPQSCEPNGDDHLVCEATFTPGDFEVDHLVRVEVTFFDDQNVLRTITSDPTTETVENVNDTPIPPVLSMESPVVGQVVRASGLQDGDGIATAGETLQWTWQVSDTGEAGTWEVVSINPYTVTGYVPHADDIGKYLRVVASYTDDHGTAEEAASLSTVDQVAEAPPAPVAPTAPLSNTAVIDGTGSIQVSWTPPVDDGGAPITGYDVTVYADGEVLDTRTAGAGATDLVVADLDTNPGTRYEFTVAAINAAGTSAASELMGPVFFGGSQPSVVDTRPNDGAVGVDTGIQHVWVNFSETMTGIGGSAVTLTRVSDGAEIDFTRGFNTTENRLYINPFGGAAGAPEQLDPGTEYRVTLTGGTNALRSLGGVPLETQSFTFTTATPEGEAPLVVDTRPNDGAVGVDTGIQHVWVNFSETMTGIGGSAVTLTRVSDGAEIDFTRGFNTTENRLYINPFGGAAGAPEQLDPGTEYRVTLTGGTNALRSLGGVPLETQSFTFTTRP
ncbi:peroxidase family protein [Nocardioides terrigena]|uniref:peroxidase family protein n=1 Tax=Nocardioides terrigena TaxID=424797 RepID=UPI00131F140F|nr:peroxidase family protein [Nocardioides terrigena]